MLKNLTKNIISLLLIKLLLNVRAKTALTFLNIAIIQTSVFLLVLSHPIIRFILPTSTDLFIDSPLYNEYSSNERVRYIFDNVRKNQLNMNVPVVMGEWGGLCPKKTDWFSHIDFVYSLIEQNQWSSIYWNYYFENDEFVRLMNRPYPIAVCGDIISYRTDLREENSLWNIRFLMIMFLPKLKYMFRIRACKSLNQITV